ncbi:MAG: Peptidase [Acidobacteria bacterium]|nr:Peptidase [Acidobacteriota bacterium]
MILVVSGGEAYAPSPLGAVSILALDGTIARIGDVDRTALGALRVDVEELDASDCYVVPGFIDPHVHLIGGSGEKSYSTSTPEIFLSELIAAGVTTVVGCLGVDTTMKTMATLVGKAKALREEGIGAYVYSGGYNVPPVSLFGSLREDMIFVDEVIGGGEIAISDLRSTQPSTAELARLVADAYVGGLLTGKAGVTHFHVGDGRARLAPLRALLDEHEVEARCLYASHVERTPQLLAEAAAITARGVYVDVDTVGDDLIESLHAFRGDGGDLSRLTVSSDASITPPRQRFDQLRRCGGQTAWPLERWLPLVTSNVAEVLKLSRKGRLQPGADADIVVLDRHTLELRHVVARGQV